MHKYYKFEIQLKTVRKRKHRSLFHNQLIIFFVPVYLITKFYLFIQLKAAINFRQFLSMNGNSVGVKNKMYLQMTLDLVRSHKKKS